MGTSRLKVLMAERDINLRELSYMAGVSYSNLSNIVSGKQIPKISIAERIASALGISVYKIWPNTYKYEVLSRRRIN